MTLEKRLKELEQDAAAKSIVSGDPTVPTAMAALRVAVSGLSANPAQNYSVLKQITTILEVDDI